jgi:hypothetical protein
MNTITPREFNACLQKVKNRGVPPVSFLNELIGWAQIAPDFLFTVNDKYDVYSSVEPELGPWEGTPHRKAVMLEVLRVLAGFESSWNWNEGRDSTNPTSDTPETEETGIFQVSCNATGFDPSLKAFVVSKLGARDCRKFIVEMKADHRFAIEFAARLLRFTVKHNGPVLRREINPWLRRDAVTEFLSFLVP